MTMLPDSNSLNFINKLLISLEALSPDGDYCSIRSLIRQCRSVAFGGQRADYQVILNHCRLAGLVQVHSSRTRISSLGKKFLSANRESYFEVTQAQKQIIAERIVFKGSWNSEARLLFELFDLNQSTELYQFSKTDRSLPSELVPTAHLFKHLGILTETDEKIVVVREYSQPVYELRADSRTVAELELERMLAENRRLGAQGELAIVDFERRRLAKMGRIVQSELVRRISTFDVGAGYDIESFDGDSDDVTPNRFIEAKATTGFELKFYWSRNEMEVAKKKKKQYWIYALVEFRPDRPTDCAPIMIQNPERAIRGHSFLTMDAHTYLIKGSEGLELEDQTLDELRWYRLA